MEHQAGKGDDMPAGHRVRQPVVIPRQQVAQRIDRQLELADLASFVPVIDCPGAGFRCAPRGRTIRSVRLVLIPLRTSLQLLSAAA